MEEKISKPDKTITIFICPKCKEVRATCKVTATITMKYTLNLNKVTGEQRLQTTDPINLYVKDLNPSDKIHHTTCTCNFCNSKLESIKIDLPLYRKLFRRVVRGEKGVVISSRLQNFIDIDKLVPYLGKGIPIEYSALITTLSL